MFDQNHRRANILNSTNPVGRQTNSLDSTDPVGCQANTLDSTDHPVGYFKNHCQANTLDPTDRPVGHLKVIVNACWQKSLIVKIKASKVHIGIIVSCIIDKINKKTCRNTHLDFHQATRINRQKVFYIQL